MSIAVSNFMFGPMLLFIPVYLDRRFGLSAGSFGVMIAFQSLGFQLAGALALTGPRRMLSALCSRLLVSLGLLAIGVAPQPFIALAGIFVMGLGLGYFNILFGASVARSTPDEMRGRVAGASGFVAPFLNPWGALAGGWALLYIDAHTEYYFIAAAAVTLTVSLWVFSSSAVRAFLRA